MAKTKYVIVLTEEDRDTLNRIITEKKESARTILRAKILLMSDINTAEKMSIPKLADKLCTTLFFASINSKKGGADKNQDTYEGSERSH